MTFRALKLYLTGRSGPRLRGVLPFASSGRTGRPASRSSLVAGLCALGLTGLFAAVPVHADPVPSQEKIALQARNFDNEPVGQPPQGCSVRGEVTVEAAQFGDVAPGNRAMRLRDHSTAQIAEATCNYAPSAEKSVSFTLAAQAYAESFLFGIRGETGNGAEGHAWWFAFTPRAGSDDALLRVYDGAAWQRLGWVDGFAGQGTFRTVAVKATADAVELAVSGQVFYTKVRRGATVNLTDVVFSTGGTVLTGMEFYVDDLEVGDELSGPPVDPRTLVAQEPAGYAPRFPDVIRLDDGRLMAAYYSGRSHTDPAGRIKVTESSDNGQNWSPPRIVVDGPHDDRDPKLTQLSDGTILLNYFITNWDDPCCSSRSQLGTHVVRSTDGGQTWSNPIWVDTRLSCSQPPPAGGCPGSTGWSASHGSLVELANGDVLAPLYGITATDGRQRATVVRSTDGGLTWDLNSEVTIAVGSIHYQEPNLTVLASGEIVAGIRTTSNPQVIYLSRSFDNGHTWTTAEPTDIPGSSHHQLLRDDGSLLLTYGDVTPGVPGRPTSGVLIPDAAGDWNGHHKFPIYDSGHGDQANPSSIELEHGVFLTLGYDVPAGRLYGIRTELDDYRDSTC